MGLFETVLGAAGRDPEQTLKIIRFTSTDAVTASVEAWETDILIQNELAAGTDPSTCTLTLPRAALCKDRIFRVRYRITGDGNTAVTVAAATGDDAVSTSYDVITPTGSAAVLGASYRSDGIGWTILPHLGVA